jgi:HEAT repeat protein
MFRIALGAILALPVVAICDDSDSTKALVSLLSKQLKDRETKKRIEAAHELGKLGNKARDAARPLCEACMDSNGKVSVAAIDAMEKIRPDLHKHIVTIVSDSDKGKHIRAFRAFEELKEEAAPVVPLLLAYVSRGSAASATDRDSPCIRAVMCLGAIAPDDTTIMQPLISVCRVHPGSYLANECIFELSKLGEAKPELRKKIMPTLTGALTTPCKISAIQGLARFKSDARDALPQLKKMRFDDNEEVRKAAVGAIEKIEASEARP